jgi:sulfatase modifying factor 1
VGIGGSAGSASDAGSDGSDANVDAMPPACQCDDPGCGQCPAKTGVAAGGYTIDATEVTNAEYAAWLATQPAATSQTVDCAWNTTFVPEQGWPAAGGDGQKPVVYVDQCDARAYCQWAKKRLCGRIGGGANAYGAFDDATQSQWYNACSVGGTKTYPYGAQYNGTACNGADSGSAASVAVGSTSSCEGGYPNLFDMSGNVWEWEDSCQGTAGAADLCRIRGGSFSQNASALGCAADSALARNTAGKSVGFRCCE